MYIEESHPNVNRTPPVFSQGKSSTNPIVVSIVSTGQELRKAAVTGSNQIDLLTIPGMGECPQSVL